MLLSSLLPHNKTALVRFVRGGLWIENSFWTPLLASKNLAFKNLEVGEHFDGAVCELPRPELGWQCDVRDPTQTLGVEGPSSCSAPPALLHSLLRATWSHPMTDTCVKSVSAQMYPSAVCLLCLMQSRPCFCARSPGQGVSKYQNLNDMSFYSLL